MKHFWIFGTLLAVHTCHAAAAVQPEAAVVTRALVNVKKIQSPAAVVTIPAPKRSVSIATLDASGRVRIDCETHAHAHDAARDAEKKR